MKKELELKHVAPYLPYYLEAINEDKEIKCVRWGIQTYTKRHVGLNFLLIKQDNDFKPLLRPMSDLFKNIEHQGKKVNVAELIVNWDDDLEMSREETGNKAIWDDDQECFLRFNIRTDRKHDNFVNGLRYWIVEILFEYHFDVFGLIEKGLAEPIKS
ncbi:hypothetical protein AB832_07700 [Flavobacteriaceae bacterium (ex Bugula neritina AB1)]|nr:hypothetical protein AB832_07700 [Flavobacteriaceae bacterium (ex Bugula neritina AB1)]